MKKNKILKYLKKNGIGFNEKHRELVSEWKWIGQYSKKNINLINAYNYREKTINLYFNEKFKEKDIEYLISIFQKAEEKFNKYLN